MRRLIDVVVAVAVIVAAAPFLLAIAGWLLFSGTRRVLYSEARVGRHGRLFRIHKFRSMREDGAAPLSVAAIDDPRITRLGRVLRPWRLDEWPQLYDVLVGNMSLVGPRPQKPENLEAIDPASLEQLQRVRPGITGPAAIEFLGEDEALAEVDDPVDVYRRVVLPEKVRLEVQCLADPSWARDFRIVWLTLVRLFSRRARRESLARIRALIAEHPRPSGR